MLETAPIFEYIYGEWQAVDDEFATSECALETQLVRLAHNDANQVILTRTNHRKQEGFQNN